MSILFRYLAILRILLISLSYYSSVTDSESNKKIYKCDRDTAFHAYKILFNLYVTIAVISQRNNR